MAFPIVGAVTAGLSLIEGITGAKDARGQARASLASIEKEMNLLTERRAKLKESFNTRKALVRDNFGNQAHSLLDSVGVSLENLQADTQDARRQSGFAFSGTVESGQRRARDRVNRRFQFRNQSLFDQLQGDLVDLQTLETDQLNDIDSRMTQLEGERGVVQQSANQRFLGIF